jgi:hypothetical protein
MTTLAIPKAFASNSPLPASSPSHSGRHSGSHSHTGRHSHSSSHSRRYGEGNIGAAQESVGTDCLISVGSNHVDAKA